MLYVTAVIVGPCGTDEPAAPDDSVSFVAVAVAVVVAGAFTEYIVVPLETVLIGAASNLISCGVVMLTMRGVVGTQLFLMIGCDRSGVLAMFAAGTNALLLVAAPVAVIPLAGRFASDSACIMLEHRLLAQWQLRLLNRFLLNGAGLQHWNRFLRPDGYCR
uniref:Uncharacterized protein n=1 Tax=Anopheles culicifacies TaxID=139723 RepID=A0A182LSG1_9DIPT